MPVIEASDVRYESFNPALECSRDENFTQLACLLVDRRGQELLSYAEQSGVDLTDRKERAHLLGLAKSIKYLVSLDEKKRADEAERWKTSGY